jgi:signal transduction histidine kinase
MGDIIIILDCKPNSTAISTDDYVLETEIIDTGLGISPDQQKMLFKPFKELKIKQNASKVQNGNIGMGLASSWELTK